MSKPNYSIVENVAKFGVYDEITGYKRFLLDTAETLAWALRKLEKRRADQDDHYAFIELIDNYPSPVVKEVIDHSDVPF